MQQNVRRTSCAVRHASIMLFVAYCSATSSLLAQTATDSKNPESQEALTITKQVVFEGIDEQLMLDGQRLRDVPRFDVTVRQSSGEVVLWVAGAPTYYFLDLVRESSRTIMVPPFFRDRRFRHTITRENPEEVLIWDNAGGEIASLDLSSGNIHMYTEEPERKSMIGSGMIPMDERMVFLCGYGFWETHNVISIFERSDASWSSVRQTNPIPNMMGGIFFKGHEQQLYTLIPNVDMNTRPRSFDGYRVMTSNAPYHHWTTIHEFVSPPMSARGRNPELPSLHSSTPDYLKHGMVVASEFTREGHFEGGVLLFDLERNEVRAYYNPDLGAKHRLLTMFYLDKAKSWVVMSQLHNDDSSLYFSFVDIHKNGNNAMLYANILDLQKRDRILQSTAAGLGSTALVGLFIFFRRQRSRSWAALKAQDADANGVETYEGVFVRPMMEQDTFVGVVIDGQDEDVTRDGQYRKFWAILLDALRRGQDSVPLQDIDDSVFHAGVKQPQRTRTRARFIERINTLAGTQILNVDRSPVDRRYRILLIQRDAIRLISDSST